MLGGLGDQSNPMFGMMSPNVDADTLMPAPQDMGTEEEGKSESTEASVDPENQLTKLFN